MEKCNLIHLGKNNWRLSCSAGERYLESTRNEKNPLEIAVGNQLGVGLYWH